MAAIEAAKENPDTDVVSGRPAGHRRREVLHLFEPYESVNEPDLLAHDPNHY